MCYVAVTEMHYCLLYKDNIRISHLFLFVYLAFHVDLICFNYEVCISVTNIWHINFCYRITEERERQRALAKERLEARKRKKNQGQLSEEELKDKLVQDEEAEAMQDAVREMEGL